MYFGKQFASNFVQQLVHNSSGASHRSSTPTFSCSFVAANNNKLSSTDEEALFPKYIHTLSSHQQSETFKDI